MKLTRISVKKLFGIFDHSVTLSEADGITILFGPNGIGKTALLKLLNSFFTSNYSDLRSIPFLELQIHFDDNVSVTITKTQQHLSKSKRIQQDEQSQLVFLYRSADAKPERYIVEELDLDKLRISSRFIEGEIPDVSRVNSDLWLMHSTGEVVTIEGIIRRFPEYFPRHIVNNDKEPQWLRDLSKRVHVRLVQAQRLVSVDSTGNRPREYDKKHAITHAVRAYSEEITFAIRSKLEEYARLSQSLDRTFPGRVLSKRYSEPLTSGELIARLDELETKRTGLRAAGLLEEEDDANFQVHGNLDSTELRVLSVYADDTEKKLDVFNDIASRIDLLKQIINDHFKYKKISVTKDHGFTFINDLSDRLSPTQLSSGEQNELVILYELLFKVQPGSLILLDEPEISLHLEWQLGFLEDIRRIAALSSLDVVIATHSPQIINDRWDLTQELTGP